MKVWNADIVVRDEKTDMSKRSFPFTTALGFRSLMRLESPFGERKSWDVNTYPLTRRVYRYAGIARDSCACDNDPMLGH